MLAEAAAELFLEKTYQHTSVDDIAHRAGVSRATFFNYFPTKADVLFSPIDRVLDTIEKAIAQGAHPLEAIADTANGVTGADRPLIATQSEAMDVGADLFRVGPARVERLRTLIASRYPHPLDNWVLAAAIASATVSWAIGNPSSTSLRGHIDGAITAVKPILSAG
jgi:AcrR family transcriptional regulator